MNERWEKMAEGTRFYKIGEVSRITGTAAHILRYWEKEFSFLKIGRDNKGQRLYTDSDIEKIQKIKSLLYGEGYRITGVKKKFRQVYNMSADEKKVLAVSLKKILKNIKEIEKCLR
jgi:DNA-binding transcriptional MerR regulator